MHVNLDPLLVDKIANEVKSQGVFDQFRKDSMADVDTKPAYQNLRQRVENTVNKFLSEQRWTPDMNKNQLRERLRKHITEAGFLDVGVERIVDQVVNPKIATVFQPKIEEIAYTYLGIPKPQPTTAPPDCLALNGVLKIETNLLPTDLEQVSPDSDKGTVKSDYKDEMETDDKMEDFESPAFEPIEVSGNGIVKIENKPDQEYINIKREVPTQQHEIFAFRCAQVKDESSSEDWDAEEKTECTAPTKQEIDCEANVSGDATQESQLSQVSSDSRLSIVTNGNTQDERSTACEIKEENNVNISEEAQMPKFNENSNSESDKKPSEPLHFDIKKDEIKFEGTERKTEPPGEEMSPNTSDEQRVDSSLENKTIDNSEASDIPLPSHEFSFEKDSDFKFSKIEVKVDLEEATKTTSLDDSADRELQIIEKSEMSQCSMSQNSMRSPMVKPKSPSATPSPLQSHKSSHRDKDQSSSRYKKYSKDRRSDKDRDKYSSSSHRLPSSSSSRHHSSKSSSSQRTSGGTPSDHHHHYHRSSSSSVHKSKSSSRYRKSSRSHHDSKDSRSRDHSKPRSDKTKEKSSKEKSDRSKATDDHYSSKHKWRKSTDSNDEDSSQEGSRACGPKDNSNSRDNATNGTQNNSNASSVTSSANNPNANGGSVDNETSANLAGQEIVILDNLLGKPETNFIKIGRSSVRVNSNINQSSRIPFDGESLFYFENENKTKEDVNGRIHMLTTLIENFRSILKGNFNSSPKQSTSESECCIDTATTSRRQDSVSPAGRSVKSSMGSPNAPSTLTSATLTIDCIQYGGSSITHCLSKRFKYNETSETKVSPTPSELSVNSKENEFVDKNAQSDSDSVGSREVGKAEMIKVVNSVKRKTIVNRNQRYSSEDLYKPRPILSQRSRRRGLDAVI